MYKVLIAIALSCLASAPLRAEKVISVSPGTYNLPELIRESGTPENWVRYQAAEPGSVIIRGGTGGILKGFQYLILDGFLVQGKLDEKYPARLYGLQILESASNVRIENLVVSGGPDLHTGFDCNGQVSCDEKRGFPTSWSVGLLSKADNVEVVNTVIHGFYAGVQATGTLALRKSLIRNNYSAVRFTGQDLILTENVLWVNPNQAVEAGGSRRVSLVNNLIVNSRNALKVTSQGVSELEVRHNTFYVPADKPCADQGGIDARHVTELLSVRDNIFVNEDSHWLNVADQQVPQVLSDDNLFYHHVLKADAWRDEFRLYNRNPSDVLFADWQILTGQDRRSLLHQAPLFQDAPPAADFAANSWGFRNPDRPEEARDWFYLHESSAGKNLASDGRDLGIYPEPPPEDLLPGPSGVRLERLVEIPSGTYLLSDLALQSGSAEEWVRYRPEQTGGVILRGGGGARLEDAQYLILDGLIVEGTLDEKYPQRLFGLQIADTASHIRIENVTVRGAQDFHTGYDATGAVNCKESAGFPTTWSVGILSQGQDVTLSNVLVHGFYDGLELNGTARLEHSLIRNNFNGVTILGEEVQLEGNVFWVHPNHGLESRGAGKVSVTNNLVVDAQEMFMVWTEGTEELRINQNTFYIPANKPCFGFEGIHARDVSGMVEIRDNLFMNKKAHWINTVSAVLPRLSSDHNLFSHYEIKPAAWRDEFRIRDRTPDEILHAEWNQLTGQDGRSLLYQQPLFADPPQYQDFQANPWGFRTPASVEEARGWFKLQQGSPGVKAASDGLDIGIR